MGVNKLLLQDTMLVDLSSFDSRRILGMPISPRYDSIHIKCRYIGLPVKIGVYLLLRVNLSVSI